MSTVLPLYEADPRTVGPYTLIGRLDGGTGSVFLATAPDGRLVVVKVVHADLSGEPEFRARFLREAQSAQRVPGFSTAAILDVNAEAPRPYLVTEYFDGPTLAEAVGRNGPIPPADLHWLAISVADALAAIHAAGIVHRDLNPANIVLSATGARVIDFGVAQPLEDARLVTYPGFKAPEQLLGGAGTPAADVYAWGGVVLFAATGRPRHGYDGPPNEVIRRALYESPDLTGLDAALAPIVAAALNKDPARRPTARRLTTALAASQPAAQPTLARDGPTAEPKANAKINPSGEPGDQWDQVTQPTRPPSPRLASTWWLRSWVILPIVMIVTALAFVGYVVTTGGEGHGDDTETTAALPSPNSPSTPRSSTAPTSPPSASPAPFVQPSQLGEPLTGHTGSVTWVAFSPDGNTLASAGDDGAVILTDVSDPTAPRQLGQPLTSHAEAMRVVVFSPDGTTLATGCDDGTVVLWDITDRTAPRKLGQPLTGHTDSVTGVEFSPDGNTLATASYDKTVILWDVSDPTAPRQLGQPLTSHTGAVNAAAFSPDGTTLATTGDDQTVILWDVSDPAAPRKLGQPLTGHTGAVWTAAFSPDGTTLATTSDDQTVILWDVSDPTAPRQLGQPLTSHTGAVYAAAFCPDGHTIATGSADTTVVLWDVTDPAAPRKLGQPLTGHTDRIYSVAYSPDGTTLATAGGDATVQLWDLDS